MPELADRILLALGEEPRQIARMTGPLVRRGWIVRSGNLPPSPTEIQGATHVMVAVPEGAAAALPWIPLLREDLPGLPLVVVAGWASLGEAALAVRSGASDVLARPISADLLEAALEQRPLPPTASIPSLERAEWEHIQRVLLSTEGNVSRTARLLGIDRRTLQRKLARHVPAR